MTQRGGDSLHQVEQTLTRSAPAPNCLVFVVCHWALEWSIWSRVYAYRVGRLVQIVR